MSLFNMKTLPEYESCRRSSNPELECPDLQITYLFRKQKDRM